VEKALELRPDAALHWYVKGGFQVTDHGKGMPPEKLAKVRSNASGVGIRGMRERVRQLRGQMNIDSGESGTTLSVTLPAALIVSESSPLGTKQTENV
jgi:signal transduction histidine kinase